MNRKIWQVTVLVAACAILAYPAGGAEVTSNASKDTVQVAEPFTLEVTVTASVGSKVTFPTIADKLGEFDVTDTQDIFDVPMQDGRAWTRRLTLETIATGEQIVPSIAIQVNESGTSTSVQSPPVTVRVASVLEERSDPTKFRDIQSVIDLDVPALKSNAWVWWTTGGTIGVGLLALAGLVLSRREDWLTPRDWAIQELAQLELSVESNSSDVAAQRVSEIVYSYLLLEFGVVDTGRTPQDLIQKLVRGKQIDFRETNRLNALFSLTDQAKFAALDLPGSSIKSLVSDTREMIQRIATDCETTRSRVSSTRGKTSRPSSGEIDLDNQSEKS